MLSILVHNRQGASDGKVCSNKSEVNAYLNSWQDPRELSAVVTDPNDNIVGHKPFGKVRISWAKNAK
jgi:hypothetical protein